MERIWRGRPLQPSSSPTTQLGNTGHYSVIVSNTYGNTTSVLASLFIASPPTTSNAPANPPGFIAACAQIDYSGADTNAR